MKGRRLVTSCADGTVKIWNFSNGQQLKELVSWDKNPRVDTEITALIGICDPNSDKKENFHSRVKPPQFLAVGWDKKLHLWVDTALRSDDEGDEDEDDAVACRDIPARGKPPEHLNDIMSCCFDLKNLLIFTGGVDGTIIGWNFETSFPRYKLH